MSMDFNSRGYGMTKQQEREEQSSDEKEFDTEAELRGAYATEPFEDKEDQKKILELIAQLPEELRRLIGSYSHHVRTQKSLVRIEVLNF